MAGENQAAEPSAQALWDEVTVEREQAEQSPSTTTAPKTEPASTTPEPTEATTPAGTPAPPAEPTDPYAGLSPELKARLEKVDQLERAISVIPQLQQHLKTAEGRVAAMQREFDVAKSAAKSVTEAPSQAQIKAASGDTQKWESLKQDFPDWAEATEQFVRASLAGLKPEQTQGLTPEQVDQMLQQRTTELRGETAKAIEEAKVEGKYENWLSDINTDKFKSWLPMQTPELQALAHSTKGRDAIKLLDAYHSATKTPASDVQQTRESKLAAAVTTRPGTSALTAKTVDQMTPTELWEYERKRAAKRSSSGLSY